MYRNPFNRAAALTPAGPTPRLGHLAWGVALAAGLSACGGGGDNPWDPIDKYNAVFVGVCHADARVTLASSGQILYVSVLQTPLSKTDPYTLYVQYSNRIYLQADCSGTPLDVLNTSGSTTWLHVDGQQVISAVVADLVTYSMGTLGLGAPAGSFVVINGITYTAGFVNGGTFKDAFFLSNGALYDGNFNYPLDANGYPTVLLTTPTALQQ